MPKPRHFYDLLKYSSLGLEMGAAVIIGLLLGIFLDRKFDTSPWLTLLFLGLGFAAGVRALIRAVRDGAFEEETDDHF
ncbi:MAG: AtpZ/AtpI family protein [Deltaproteobacteria bacterium]|nr:AtpZ/AtpI family protein [Deltaproteobacteria bacterium]